MFSLSTKNLLMTMLMCDMVWHVADRGIPGSKPPSPKVRRITSVNRRNSRRRFCPTLQHILLSLTSQFSYHARIGMQEFASEKNLNICEEAIAPNPHLGTGLLRPVPTAHAQTFRPSMGVPVGTETQTLDPLA